MTQQLNQDDERLGLISASDAAGWSCAGKKKLCATLPPEALTQPEDPSATSGTRVHRAFETGNTLELSEEEAEVYNQGLKFLDQLVQQWMRDRNLSDCEELSREERYWYRHPETMEPLTSAKLDRQYISGEDAMVIDAKTGWVKNLVPSPRSTQLRVQAVCFWKEFPQVKRIRVAHCKARLKVGTNDYADYTTFDLENADRHILFHLWQSEQEDAPFTPGPHCNYCPAKAYCRMAGAYSLLPSVVAENAIQKVDIEAAVARMQPADLKRLWQSKSIVEKILDTVVGRLKGMSEEELASLGLKIGKGRALDRIVDTKGAFDFLSQALLDGDRLWGCMSFSKGDLAKVVRSAKGLSSDKAASEWIKTALEDFIEKKNAEGSIQEL
jgi:hypothetical protein